MRSGAQTQFCFFASRCRAPSSANWRYTAAGQDFAGRRQFDRRRALWFRIAAATWHTAVGSRSQCLAFLAKQLEAAGFIVFALETEGRLRAGQLNTVLRSMLAINTVDAGKIGIVGAEGSADLALLGCAINDLCDAAALLSPLSRDTLLNMMPSYDTRPLWVAAAKDDIEAYAAALALSQTALGEVQFHELNSGRGIDLLNEQAKPGRRSGRVVCCAARRILAGRLF